jgi:hypothetical protein
MDEIKEYCLLNNYEYTFATINYVISNIAAWNF